ncbi:MAG TPA: ABC transporter permease [Thermosulfurimonas dismutans]|uniref:Transport permease protein n=1 Tax=Thermosulfurimonas dismutans TaxID=999894 RepID=A0A7C3H5P3_9BACT|nr:ABC transporter permease [Thermosulfurimonas dismutans]
MPRPRRILGVVARQMFLYRRSVSRLLDLFYWPTMDLLLWGFLTLYLERGALHLPRFVSFFLGALILWHILYRSQLAVSVSFLEDIWSRNLLNVLVAPITLTEYLLGLVVISLIKVGLAFGIMTTLSVLFYGFNLLKLGAVLFPLVVNLLALGWAIGFVTIGFIFRFGQEAEILAWALIFVFLPLSAVFYPVEVLPAWLKPFSLLTPSAHVFEGMREVITRGTLPWKHLLFAGLLNLVYLGLGLTFLKRQYQYARRMGLIPKIGE